jgi:hypothetical protein
MRSRVRASGGGWTRARVSGSSLWCAARRPRGQARWSVQLIAQEAVKRKLVPRVGRESSLERTFRDLQSTDGAIN